MNLSWNINNENNCYIQISIYSFVTSHGTTISSQNGVLHFSADSNIPVAFYLRFFNVWVVKLVQGHGECNEFCAEWNKICRKFGRWVLLQIPAPFHSKSNKTVLFIIKMCDWLNNILKVQENLLLIREICLCVAVGTRNAISSMNGQKNEHRGILKWSCLSETMSHMSQGCLLRYLSNRTPVQVNLRIQTTPVWVFSVRSPLWHHHRNYRLRSPHSDTCPVGSEPTQTGWMWDCWNGRGSRTHSKQSLPCGNLLTRRGESRGTSGVLGAGTGYSW